jgi:PKD repeat protein
MNVIFIPQLKQYCIMLLLVVAAFSAKAQIAGEDTVCIADAEVYSTSLSGIVNWSVSPTGPTIIAAGSNATISWNTIPTTYTITANNGIGIETFVVNVYAIPDPDIQYEENACSKSFEEPGGGAAGDHSCDTFCINEIVNYSVTLNPDNFYSWTISGGAIISGQGTASIEVIWGTASCGSLVVTETNPAGCAATDFAKGIAAFPNGNISITAVPSSACLNSPIFFDQTSTGGPFISSVWDFGDGTIITNNTGISDYTYTYTYTTPGTYTVILTGFTECCSTSDTIEVVIDNLAGPDIFCITPVCENTNGVQYCTNAAGCSYTWIVNAPNLIVAGQGTNCVTVNWVSGPVGEISLIADFCSPAVCSDTTTITVPIMPDGNFVINGPTIVCINNVGNYLAPFVPGSIYNWTLIDPAGVATVLNYNFPPYQQDIIFNTAGNYTLICHMENDILECAGDDTLNIQVLPQYHINGNQNICAGSPTNFATAPGVFSTWTTSDPTHLPQTGVSSTFTFITPGTYTVTATAVNPLLVCNSPQTFQVTVYPLPATPVINGTTIVCPSSAYNYNVTGYGPAAIYSWTFIDNLGNFISGNSSSFDITTAGGFTNGTISITVFENGCSATNSILIEIPSTPSPLLPILNAVCPDQISTYTAALTYPGLSNVNWIVNPPGAGTILSGQGTPTITIEWHAAVPNAPQAASITVEETICLSITGTVVRNVLINPTPSIIASGSDFCPGTSTTLSATPGTFSYNWFDVNGVAISPVVTVEGDYYVVGTDPFTGCSATAYVSVEALPQPVASISTPDLVACDGNGVMTNTIQLYAEDNGYSFVWSPGGSTSNPLTVSALGTYTVTVTAQNGCTNTDTYEVECISTNGPCALPACACVNDPATITQSSPYCDEFTFIANSSCTGTPVWDFGDGTSATGNTVTHTFSEAGYYIVCYNNGDPGCCPPATSCTSVDVPVASDFDVEMICNTLSVFNNASVLPPYFITGYLWEFGDGNTSTTANPAPHNYLISGTYDVVLHVYANNGCIASDTIQVTTAGPDIAVNIPAIGCNGLINFSANIISGNIAEWNWDFGDGQGSNSQNPQHIYGVSSTYNVTLTATSTSGCTFTVSSPITITPAPPAFNLTYVSPSCGASLITAPSGYTMYQWYNNGIIISGANASSYLATQTGNYSVVATDNNGCFFESNIANVIIQLQPAAFITINPDIICSNLPITFNSNASGPFNYAWTINGIPYFGGVSLTVNAAAIGVGTHLVEVIVTDPNTGCADTTSTSFTINPGINPSIFIGDPSGVCQGDSIMLKAQPSGQSYLWNTNETINPIYVHTTGNYSVIVTNIYGCSGTASANAVIHELPDLSMLPIGCDSSCISPNPEIIHGPPGMASYNWEVNNVTVSTSQDLTITPAIMPVFNIPYTVMLTATSTNGCVDSASFEYTPLDCPDTVGCFDAVDTVYCNADGSFTLELIITNNGPATSTYLWIHDISTPFTFTPTFVIPLTLTSGQTSAPIPIQITYPTGTILPSDICYKLSLYNTDDCCHDTTTYCIPTPDCTPCGNVSAVADTTSDDCCKLIDITNNYGSNYFTGVQFVPVSTGTSIASAQLGTSYLGSWGAMGSSTQMTFTHNSGFIPTGSMPGLVDLCLNLTGFSPPTQIVLVNWIVPGVSGDSIACTDTIEFNCIAPMINPCGSIDGVITCVGDGTYVYNYTFTNNSLHDVTMLVFTNTNPVLNIIPNPIMLPAPVPYMGVYSGSVIIDPGIYPPGTNFCFDLTLADATGWCCHEMDSICIILPVCEVCTCGSWETFGMNVDVPGALDYSILANCDDSFVNIPFGTNITTVSGGYTCSGDPVICPGDLLWTLIDPNGTTTSGAGYPSLTFNISGTYVLTFTGVCNGADCGSCTIKFVVLEDCICGTWGPISVKKGNKLLKNQPCGTNFAWTTGVPIIISGAYNCSGVAECAPTYSWTATRNGVFYASGTSMPVNFIPAINGNYTVTIVPGCNGVECPPCTFTFKVKNAIPKEGALMEDDNFTMRIAPNPATTQVKVTLDEATDRTGNVYIINELGVVVMQHSIEFDWNNTIEFNVEQLPAGCYMVKYLGENQSDIEQLVIVR